MKNHLADIAKKLFTADFEKLSEREKRIVKRYNDRQPISRDTTKDYDTDLTFGQRLADRVASFGGSWTFILIFAAVLIVWVLLNAYLLMRSGDTFDPYPYILLNLFLSMLAAIQAPVILMSQNRQSVKDRLDAEHDYEVNLKAELEIMGLHEKIDELREAKWSELINLQQEQIELLTQLLGDKSNKV